MIGGSHRSNEIREQPTLLPSSELIDWLPDETVFSLASRYHTWSGHNSAKATCLTLFGDSRQGHQHDFPSNIDEFVSRTRGELGASEEILKHRTILPYYLPFRPPAVAADAYTSLRTGGLGSLKYRLGILTSRFRANHPLKACRTCMSSDRACFGISYWHVTHQLPGAWVCLDHQETLLVSTMKSTGVGRFLWHLPSEAALVPAVSSNSLTSADIDRLGKVARLARSLWSLPCDFHFDACTLIACYSQALIGAGFITAGGSLRARELGEALAEWSATLRIITEFDPLFADPAAAAAQARRLIRPPRSGTHPLRHLVLVLWLFGEWGNFIEAYQQQSDIRELSTDLTTTDIQPIGQIPQETRQAKAVSLLRGGRLSIAQIARCVSADHATVSGWAAAAGVDHVTGTRLANGLGSDLIDSLRRGTEKEVIARSYGVSILTINRTLRREAGLLQAWSDARLERLRSWNRSEWMALLGSCRGATAKTARAFQPAVYAWLYRNDRAWLVDSIARLPSARTSNNSAVDWDQRDVSLAADVQRTAVEVEQQNPGVKIKLWQLYQRLPALKAKLSALDRLPLTRRAIEAALRSSRRHQRGDSLFP